MALLRLKGGRRNLLKGAVLRSFTSDALQRLGARPGRASRTSLWRRMWLFRLRMGMAQWSNEVLESYCEVQRALVRARQQQRLRVGGPKTPPTIWPTRTASEQAAEPPSPRGGDGSVPSQAGYGSQGEDGEWPDPEEYDALPTEEPGGERAWWTEEEWKQWCKGRRKDCYDDGSSSGEDLAWDELETGHIQVLLDEVLGWLLLRRANLSAASRLSVQASVQNSLFFRDIENALRDGAFSRPWMIYGRSSGD